MKSKLFVFIAMMPFCFGHCVTSDKLISNTEIPNVTPSDYYVIDLPKIIDYNQNTGDVTLANETNYNINHEIKQYVEEYNTRHPIAIKVKTLE